MPTNAQRTATFSLFVFGALLPLVGSGCATLGAPGTANSLVPTRHETRTGPYVVYTHTPLAADAPAVRQLQALERQVETTLGVRVDPGEHPIEIYILSDQKSFDHFLKTYYPELPSRRAFFLAQGQRRVVYTYFNPQLEIDLRHEASHALLHSEFADLPLWLDEGLAEYFEVPEDRAGVNPEHLGKLPGNVSAGWNPNLVRLERIQDVRLMSPRDYRESWAWVHYFLNGPTTGKAALLGYLADLRSGKESLPPMSRRLDAGSEEEAPGPAMVAYLGKVREPAPMARMQDPAVIPAANVVPATKPSMAAAAETSRSFFGRFFDRFRN